MDFSASNKQTVDEYVDALKQKANDIKKTTDAINNTADSSLALMKTSIDEIKVDLLKVLIQVWIEVINLPLQQTLKVLEIICSIL